MRRWGLQGVGKVEGRGWGGDLSWLPLLSHAPPCYVRSSRAGSESCWWGQQDAGGSRGGRPGASAAQLAGPGGACVAAGARPQPHASPCSPGSASGALPWPGGRGPRRVEPALPGRRLDQGTLGPAGSQVSWFSSVSKAELPLQPLSNIAITGALQAPALREVGSLVAAFRLQPLRRCLG